AVVQCVPAGLGADEPAAWRVASAVYAFGAVLFFVHSARRNRSQMGRLLIAGGVTATLFAICVGDATALALNAAGTFAGQEGGIYFAALFFHFLATCFFFLRLLYGALPSDVAAAGRAAAAERRGAARPRARARTRGAAPAPDRTRGAARRGALSRLGDRRAVARAADEPARLRGSRGGDRPPR